MQADREVGEKRGQITNECALYSVYLGRHVEWAVVDVREGGKHGRQREGSVSSSGRLDGKPVVIKSVVASSRFLSAGFLVGGGAAVIVLHSSCWTVAVLCVRTALPLFCPLHLLW